eukprot:gene7496-8327_t
MQTRSYSVTEESYVQLNVGRAAKIATKENQMPQKRTALRSISNVTNIQTGDGPVKGKSLAATQQQSYVGNKHGGMQLRKTSQSFPIHVDAEGHPRQKEIVLEDELLNLCKQDDFKSVQCSVVSPMVVSPCIADTRQTILGEDVAENICRDSELEYEGDILRYLETVERKVRPRVGYMDKQQDINHSMRTILVDWLIEVGEEFSIRDQTLFLTVSYIDRFLSVMSVVRTKLQLVGTACMLLASKFEEVYAPEVTDFVYITDDTYSSKQLLRMEKLVLFALDYNLSTPTALNFLEAYLVIAGCKRTDMENIGSENTSEDDDSSLHGKLYCLAKYICESTLMDSKTFLGYLPSTVAAASVSLAARILGLPPWCEALGQKTSLTMEDIEGCTKHLVSMFKNISTSSQQTVRVKYSAAKYHHVSKIDVSKVALD